MDQHLAPRFDFHGVQNFQARPDDIVIATYPKAGTTWISYILDQLYFGQTNPERQVTIPIDERVPFLECSMPTKRGSWLQGADLADNLPTTPRLIKTHLPVQLIPKSFWEQNSRIVCGLRNAKDTVVSYFHFNRMDHHQLKTEDWSCYLKDFMEGKKTFGSWYDHVNGWWEKKRTFSNLHFIFYEDLVQDCGRELKRLCSFLGLSPSSEEIERVLALVTFDNMRQNNMVNYSTAVTMDLTVSPFIRKGKVGDWKNHFTVAQNEEFDEDYRKKMKDSALKFRTEIQL